MLFLWCLVMIFGKAKSDYVVHKILWRSQKHSKNRVFWPFFDFCDPYNFFEKNFFFFPITLEWNISCLTMFLGCFITKPFLLDFIGRFNILSEKIFFFFFWKILTFLKKIFSKTHDDSPIGKHLKKIIIVDWTWNVLYMGFIMKNEQKKRFFGFSWNLPNLLSWNFLSKNFWHRTRYMTYLDQKIFYRWSKKRPDIFSQWR